MLEMTALPPLETAGRFIPEAMRDCLAREKTSIDTIARMTGKTYDAAFKNKEWDWPEDPVMSEPIHPKTLFKLPVEKRNPNDPDQAHCYNRSTICNWYNSKKNSSSLRHPTTGEELKMDQPRARTAHQRALFDKMKDECDKETTLIPDFSTWNEGFEHISTFSIIYSQDRDFYIYKYFIEADSTIIFYNQIFPHVYLKLSIADLDGAPRESDRVRAHFIKNKREFVSFIIQNDNRWYNGDEASYKHAEIRKHLTYHVNRCTAAEGVLREMMIKVGGLPIPVYKKINAEYEGTYKIAVSNGAYPGKWLVLTLNEADGSLLMFDFVNITDFFNKNIFAKYELDLAPTDITPDELAAAKTAIYAEFQRVDKAQPSNRPNFADTLRTQLGIGIIAGIRALVIVNRVEDVKELETRYMDIYRLMNHFIIYNTADPTAYLQITGSIKRGAFSGTDLLEEPYKYNWNIHIPGFEWMHYNYKPVSEKQMREFKAALQRHLLGLEEKVAADPAFAEHSVLWKAALRIFGSSAAWRRVLIEPGRG